MNNRKWEILAKTAKKDHSIGDIIDVLLKNRGITKKADKENFLNPPHPKVIPLKDYGISAVEMKKAVARIGKALKTKEKVVIYGDYDADGVTASAILWEALYKKGIDVMPYLPERSSEGYGIKADSVLNLKKDNPNLKLVITVDNGIVAFKEIKKITDSGIDVIITDHHHKEQKTPDCTAIIHTTKLSGSGVAWVFSQQFDGANGLELATIGTLADQVPLIGPSRSITKWGLIELRNSSRPGLNELCSQSGITKEKIGNYEVGYILAPRINAMGRMEHAIDSLRLLCTKDSVKAKSLALKLGETNLIRKKTLEEVVNKVKDELINKTSSYVIVLSHESYHEGIIGLAASRLTEEFYRPSIVLSLKETIAKASARSIPGFNIIEAIKATKDLIEEGGGHEMAAGFSIKPENISKFTEEINNIAKEILTEELLTKKLKIDLTIPLKDISWQLLYELIKFEPTGTGNYTPTFVSKKVRIKDIKLLGQEKKHAKLILEQDGKLVEAIAFRWKDMWSEVEINTLVDVAYTIDENEWNGSSSIQLKVKDIKNAETKQ